MIRDQPPRGAGITETTEATTTEAWTIWLLATLFPLRDIGVSERPSAYPVKFSNETLAGRHDGQVGLQGGCGRAFAPQLETVTNQ